MIGEEEWAEVQLRYTQYLKFLDDLTPNLEDNDDDDEELEIDNAAGDLQKAVEDTLRTDLGVDDESGRAMEELLEDIGIPPDQTLPGLHRVYHKEPYPSWTAGKSPQQARDIQVKMARASPLPDDWQLLRLKYHQVVGIHAIFRRLAASVDETLHEGILIADDVGVGKTAQALASMALLSHLCAQTQGKNSKIRGALFCE